MTAHTLRPYQEHFVTRVLDALRRHRAVIGQAPTGAGKTRMAAWIIKRAVAAGYCVLFLAHLDSLVEDTHERVTAEGIRAGFVQAGRPEDPDAPVQVASIATIAARGTRPFAGKLKILIIADECHHGVARTWATIFAAYPQAGLLGLTATPQRGDGRAMGDVFDCIVTGPTNAELVRDGFLSPVDVHAADRVTKDLSRDPVEAYLELPRDAQGELQRSVFFAANIAHATALTADLVARGVPSTMIIGETKRADRRRIRDGLVEGTMRAVVGVGVFLEGWDVPPIEVVVLARAFSVWGAWLQAIGRGRRPHPATGKTVCTVLDLHGCFWNFAPPDERLKFSLEGEPMSLAEPMPKVTRCRECRATFRPSARCPRCGAATKGSPLIPRKMSRSERLELVSRLPRTEQDRRYVAQIARCRKDLSEADAWAWAKRTFEQRRGRPPEVHG